MNWINRNLLIVTYKLGEKLKKPTFLIFSLWLPIIFLVILISISSNLNLILNILLITSIPVAYVVTLMFVMRIKRIRKHKSLKPLGVLKLGSEEKLTEWLYKKRNEGRYIDLPYSKLREKINQL